ncbi:alpha/beta hydrolase [Acrocarpospora macrocephala]|uniref:Alpha/beta hydrolase n=1 Tax=Acrocarpospora macrocephala TaxID=150177 RepID=A0A5M3WTG5_9ACTN|nr:alpha/beta hydrolase [Acrocarpospora macrocephala]GES12184.1 alpha/beta hydrolase [Acrocarpospora macrocephala]
MATVQSKDGTTIGYDQVGQGPALVLVDAAGGFRGFGPMGALAAELASSFTVVTYDRRGRGESTDTLPYAIEREVEDLGAVIAAVGGPAFVEGFSSGSVLALYAAGQGLPITKVAMLEPPLDLDGPPDTTLAAELTELVTAGRRGDAVLHFHASIGVPEEITAGMRHAPFWPELEKLAHTLVYDTTITSTLTTDQVRAITVPTLVVNSEETDDRLRGWATHVATTLPNGEHRQLKGEWHGVTPEVLAPVLTEFFLN